MIGFETDFSKTQPYNTSLFSRDSPDAVNAVCIV